MYDPTPGRWLNEDPIGFDGDGANLYRYVTNQPLMNTDPDGLKIRGRFGITISGAFRDIAVVKDDPANAGLWASRVTIKYYPTFAKNGVTGFNDQWENPKFPPPTLPKEDPCICTKVQIYQMAATRQIEDRWSGYADNSASLQRLHEDDYENLKREPWNDNDQTGMGARKYLALLVDDPGLTDGTDANNVIFLSQRFETTAVCVDRKSKHYREIFGSLLWGHVIYRPAYFPGGNPLNGHRDPKSGADKGKVLKYVWVSPRIKADVVDSREFARHNLAPQKPSNAFLRAHPTLRF